MRIGNNPNKDQRNEQSTYRHQIIIPVYIPNLEGYFKDSFAVLKLCLQSVFDTAHSKTFITIVNNGSCDAIKNYLSELHNQNKIHEIIHTNNIGKLNAIIKGLAGNNIALVTISDCDVLFKKGWQKETNTIFRQIPKVGVVGIVPQFNTHKTNSFNLIIDNLFNSKLRFIRVKDEDSLLKFYDSIGWGKSYNPDYLKYTLGLLWNKELKVLVGSGHFVATYKKDIFERLVSNIPFKMGGYSERYLDETPLFKDYWRVTTCDNYGYHMGNRTEDWMNKVNNNTTSENSDSLPFNFKKAPEISKIKYILKNKILQKMFRNKFLYKKFLRWKKLPTNMINNY